MRAALALVVVALSVPAAARDCGRAATRIDRVLCRDPDLARLDDEVSGLYRQIGKSVMTSSVRAALLRQQREWLVHRDAACRPADPACLAARYRERRDRLAALSAAATAAGGRLDAVVPAILRGSWTIGSVLDPERPGGSGMAEVDHALDFANLPRPGETATAGPARFCVTGRPCEAVGWSATTVGALPDGAHVTRDLGLPTGSRAYTGGTGSPRWAFTLVARGPRDLVAVFGLCGPNATDCRTAYEPWRPADDGARME